MIFYKEGLLNAEGRALLPRASQESSMTMFIANAKKKIPCKKVHKCRGRFGTSGEKQSGNVACSNCCRALCQNQQKERENGFVPGRPSLESLVYQCYRTTIQCI